MKKNAFIVVALLSMLITGCNKPNKSNSQEPSVSNSTQESSSVSNSTSKSESSYISTSSFSSASASQSSQSQALPVEINLVNESSNVCSITHTPTHGVPGSQASFLVSMKSGYTKKEVTATDSNSRNIPLEANGNNYSFAIPEDGYIYVTVTAEKEAKTQKLIIKDPKGILQGAPQYVTMTGVTTITDLVVGEGDTYYRVNINSKIRFNFPNKANYTTLGLTFNNRNYTPNANNYVEIDFTDRTGDLLIEVFGQKAGSPLVANNSEHLTITFNNKAKTEVIDTVVTETEYYVVITSEDKDVYLLDTLNLKYTNKGSSTATEASFKISDVTETATGWELLRKSSSMATNEEGFIWSVTEDNLNKYINEPFCGDYVAFTTFTYQYTDYSDLSLSRLQVLGSGKVTYKTRAMKIKAFDIDENNVYTLKNKDEYFTEFIYFQDGCLIAGFNGSNDTFGTPFYTSATDSLSDDLYAFKMTPDSNVSDYSVTAQAFTIDGVTYVISVINYQNNFYKAMLTKRDKTRHVKEFYTNVTIELLYGNSFMDNQAIYNIKKGDTVLASIGFSGNGGNRNKTLLPAYGGLYQNGQDQLVVCDGVAIYNGKMFVPFLDNNGTTLTLRNATGTYILELNLANKTFTVTSSQVNTLEKGPFAGKKFRHQFLNGITYINTDSEEDTYGYYVEFASDTAKLSCVADIYWNMTMTNLSQYAFGKTKNADYYYDANTGKITAMILGDNNEYIIMEFTYSEGKIKFNTDMLSGNKGVFIDKEIVLDEVTA